MCRGWDHLNIFIRVTYLQAQEMCIRDSSKVEYVVAHGISTTIDDKNVIIGSSHFVFEDEKCTIPEGKQELFDSLPEEYLSLIHI